MAKHPKPPRDPNLLAKMIVDMTTGELPNDSPKAPKHAGHGGEAEGWGRGRQG